METHPLWIAALFGTFLSALMLGIPVAWALGGSAFMITGLCAWSNAHADGSFALDWNTFSLSVERIFGLVENETLVALPMFVLMGHILDKSGISGALMESITHVFRRVRGGLAFGVVVIGVLLAASTGIIGASVVLLGTICLPSMLASGYSVRLASGIVCGAGTLGILIPPSIMLVIMADRLQLPVADLFMASLIPGLILAGLYGLYIFILAQFNPQSVPLASTEGNDVRTDWLKVFKSVVPVFLLILAVLGSIFLGIAPPTEASGLGAFGALILGLVHRGVNRHAIRAIFDQTVNTMGFLFAIFIGASCFALALRLLGGDDWIREALTSGRMNAMLTVAIMLAFIFILGFFLDWIEITLIVLPIVSQIVDGLSFPWAETWGGDQAVLLWFAILCALVLQTSFLTPPVGFALFYLKGASREVLKPRDLYLGIIPFVAVQLVAVFLVFLFPVLVNWLPQMRG